MSTLELLNQNDGKVTMAFYERLAARGILGEIGVALLRAQKRSMRAKQYRSGKWKREAYSVKTWSIGELCKRLSVFGTVMDIVWGWKEDPAVKFEEESSWVLYVDLPDYGQVSFHSRVRGAGPDYAGEWDGEKASETRIARFCDSILA